MPDQTTSGSDSSQEAALLRILLLGLEELKREIRELGDIVRGNHIEKEWYATNEAAEVLKKSAVH